MIKITPALLTILLNSLLLSASVLAATDSETTAAEDMLTEVLITAPESRYVAPTRRDQIGCIWTPIYINDQGPFRFVLDTGATHSAVTAAVATALNLTPDTSSNVILRGVTGSAVVPTIRVDTLHAGDLLLAGKRLPIITDALGGSEGILGTEGLADKRIYINFRHDLIRITRSHGERADPDFITVPVNFGRGKLLMVDSRMRLIRLKAIIGTGGQVSIANLTARDALAKRLKGTPTVDNITGATADVQEGESHIAPMMEMSDIQIRSSHIAFGDTQIFKQWKMTDEPAVLIGMDVLGLLDTLVIDYQRAELQMKRRTGW